MPNKNSDRHCKAITKDGKRCRAAATPGGLCFFHSNPNKASELGRIGGRSKGGGTRAVGQSEPLPTLITVAAVLDAVARLITDVHAGRLHPKVAASLGPLLNLQLRVIETTELERRIARIETSLSKADAPTEPDLERLRFRKS